MELDYRKIVEKLIEIFEDDKTPNIPVLHDAIRCLNQQAQKIETLESMLKTLEHNSKKTEDDLLAQISYYLGQYEKVSEMIEQKIDANYNLRVLHSAMVDGIRVLYKELISETDALDMKIYVDIIYRRVMDKYEDGLEGIIRYEDMD